MRALFSAGVVVVSALLGWLLLGFRAPRLASGEASVTADVVLALRALSSPPLTASPEEASSYELRDSPARELLPGWWPPSSARLLFTFGRLIRWAKTHLYIVARTRWLDDVVMSRRRGSVKPQLVLLGAGYDTRAWRLHDAGQRVFEVDASATQAEKLRRIGAAGMDASRATFVPVDFTQGGKGGQELLPLLVAAGLNPHAPTTVIWEGVTPYLSEEDVDATLRQLSRIPRVIVAFDYRVALAVHDAAGWHDGSANSVKTWGQRLLAPPLLAFFSAVLREPLRFSCCTASQVAQLQEAAVSGPLPQHQTKQEAAMRSWAAARGYEVIEHVEAAGTVNHLVDLAFVTLRQSGDVL
jgi:methyltransferase (TIGR00027 family)